MAWTRGRGWRIAVARSEPLTPRHRSGENSRGVAPLPRLGFADFAVLVHIADIVVFADFAGSVDIAECADLWSY